MSLSLTCFLVFFLTLQSRPPGILRRIHIELLQLIALSCQRLLVLHGNRTSTALGCHVARPTQPSWVIYPMMSVRNPLKTSSGGLRSVVVFINSAKNAKLRALRITCNCTFLCMFSDQCCAFAKGS